MGSSNLVSGDARDLQSEVEYRTKLLGISNKISAASNLDEILIGLQEDIISLFDAERLTVYYIDGIKRELVSRFKSGDEVSEIRVPLAPQSPVGYSSQNQEVLNIKDVYNDSELSDISPKLKFDKSWDLKTGFNTKQVLVVPIVYKKILLGSIQLINRKDGNNFTDQDEENIKELADIMGIGLYNQKKIASAKKARKSGKFDYLLENHILTQKELNIAITSARRQEATIEDVLIKDFKVTKKSIGESLAKYYNVQFVEFNKTIAIPTDLLANVKVPFLRNNVCGLRRKQS